MQGIRQTLLERLDGIVRRNTAVQHHLRGGDGRGEELGDDRANIVDNDEVLEALDEAGRLEVAQIHAALARMDAGSWTECTVCGKDIGLARLKALPYTTRCIRCAD